MIRRSRVSLAARATTGATMDSGVLSGISLQVRKLQTDECSAKVKHAKVPSLEDPDGNKVKNQYPGKGSLSDRHVKLRTTRW